MLLRTRMRAGSAAGPAPAGARPPPGRRGPVPPPPAGAAARPLEELLAELDELVGLAGVKREVQAGRRPHPGAEPAPRARACRWSSRAATSSSPATPAPARRPSPACSPRSTGPSASSSKGHLVETDRSGLVAGYVGQTAIQVARCSSRPIRACCSIDEAYALARGGERDFGQEAIDTLVKLVEDHRDDIVVICAGYPDEMDEFIDSNPGLRSRFPKTIHFPDYSTDELLAIFESSVREGRLRARPRTPRGRGAGVARRRAPRQGLRQRPAGAQPVRGGHGRPGQPHRGRTGKDPTDEQLTALTADDIAEPCGRRPSCASLAIRR